MEFHVGDTIQFEQLSLIAQANRTGESLGASIILPKELGDDINSVEVEYTLSYVRLYSSSTNSGHTSISAGMLKNSLVLYIMGSYSACCMYGILFTNIKFAFK